MRLRGPIGKFEPGYATRLCPVAPSAGPTLDPWHDSARVGFVFCGVYSDLRIIFVGASVSCILDYDGT